MAVHMESMVMAFIMCSAIKQVSGATNCLVVLAINEAELK